jgi:Predicted esterase of the alpha-beta hydrolase superfamily
MQNIFVLRRKMQNSNKSIALVLAGGGARGAYEAGVMKYILEELPN